MLVVILYSILNNIYSEPQCSSTIRYFQQSEYCLVRCSISVNIAELQHLATTPHRHWSTDIPTIGNIIEHCSNFSQDTSAFSETNGPLQFTPSYLAVTNAAITKDSPLLGVMMSWAAGRIFNGTKN